MPASVPLTKTDFLEGLRCSKAMWLSRHAPARGAPPDEAGLARMEEGQAVGRLARTLFPGGLEIDVPSTERAAAVEATRRALAGGAPALFEAAFEHDGVFVRVDVLRRGGVSFGFDLIEVKSTTKVEDEHLFDVGIQRHVLEACGLTVATAGVLHLNAEYGRSGPIDPANLFVLDDVTARIADLAGEIEERISEFRDLLARTEAPPDAEIGRRCDSPHPCAFVSPCWDGIPDGSIYDVTWLGDAACSALRARGILDPSRIPADFPIPSKARVGVEAAREGRERWNHDEVRTFLGSLRHPVRFLDFETIGPAIPPFDGTHPYDTVPFQFSLHVQEAPEAPIRHVAHLSDPAGDFRADFSVRLADALGASGSVLHWTAYETKCIARLAEWAPPPIAERLGAVLPRLVDLARPFQRKDVVIPATLGSYSVKRVLPALVPDLSYADLDIADGLAAARAFRRMMDPAAPRAETSLLRERLERYCERDTWAMVRILEVLRIRSGTPG